MKNYLLLLLFLIAGSGLGAQDTGMLYGTVSTTDKQSFTGQIRWDDEEAFWTDIFNARKKENVHVEQLSNKEFKQLRRQKTQRSNRLFSFGLLSMIRVGNGSDMIHEFSCAFGHIQSIEPLKNQQIRITLRNGDAFRVGGSGYNDIGNTIMVHLADEDVHIAWGSIRKIEFSTTPSDWKSPIGQPLYGTVNSRIGSFSGLIEWDLDERLTTDILDGENGDRDFELPFSTIAKIENEGNGSLVHHHDGRSLYLDDENDVDDDNDGIAITHPDFGRVVLDWSDFETVEFEPVPENFMPGYDDFQQIENLKGSVRTRDGQTLDGDLVFDLDESYSFELLQGYMASSKFEIPFAMLDTLVVDGPYSSTLRLKSNISLTLEVSQDVTHRNSGMLIQKAGEDPKYLKWKNVAQIVFQ